VFKFNYFEELRYPNLTQNVVYYSNLTHFLLLKVMRVRRAGIFSKTVLKKESLNTT
jgi:hypothetical protein